MYAKEKDANCMDLQGLILFVLVLLFHSYVRYNRNVALHLIVK